MQNKLVRDLAWVVSSPSLIKQQADWPDIVDSVTTLQDSWTNQWLSCLNSAPSALQKHLSQEKSHFIGAYFESLWAFYLLSNPRYELLAKNLQANSNKRTEGEFDFIIWDNEKSVCIHQEIAIKFYLGFDQENYHKFTDGKNIWLGPQCKDRLDLKMDKMLNSQINLSTKNSGKQALKSVNIDTDTTRIETQLVMKGYLFYPKNPTVVSPRFCNQNHLKGLWFTLDEFAAYIEESNFNAWAMLTKAEWVSPYSADISAFNISTDRKNNESCFTERPDIIRAVKDKVTIENRPWMIACLIRRDNVYFEKVRLFAVPDSWPQIDTL